MAEPLRLVLDPPWRLAAGTVRVRGSMRERQAVRIRLRDAAGRVGLGEAMPLPGYSHDDADAAWTALAGIAAQAAEHGLRVLDGVPEAGAAAAATWLDAALAPYATLLDGVPSARFALECALVDLLARRAGLSAARWLAGAAALQAVAVSVLLPDDDSAAVAAAAAAAALGHGVLKLKIARPDRTPGAEDALLAALRVAIDAARPAPSVALRLDANGALSLAGLPARLVSLSRHGIELVEEPVSGTALLEMPPLPLPWAADESLADPALARALLALPPGRAPAALVLKPAQLGLARCLVLADAAAQRGIGVVVTHSFDGDLGHAAACALAAALPLPPWPCGLAPHPGLHRPPPALAWLQAPTCLGLGLADEAPPP